MTDIIVLTFNRLAYFKVFTDQLYERTKYPFRLIVVDNGSTDGTRDYIKRLRDEGRVWKFLFTDQNLPMAKAFTAGYGLVESEYFVTVADDMIPPRPIGGVCWLELFVKTMDKDENVGSINLVGARQIYSHFIKNNYEHSRGDASF